MDLRETSHHDDAIVGRWVIGKRGIVRRFADVVVIRLVDKNLRRGFKKADESFYFATWYKRSRGIVRIAYVDQSGLVRKREHSRQIQRVIWREAGRQHLDLCALSERKDCVIRGLRCDKRLFAGRK